MKILALGDIFGRPGRKIITAKIDDLKKEYDADFIIVNIENASGGKGVSEINAKELLSLQSIDIFTSGNHIWDKKDINNLIQETGRLIRPANYPDPCPGRGYSIVRLGEKRIGVINLSGNVYLGQLNNPFLTFDSIYSEIAGTCDIICVDFHAEATSEKIAFGYYTDGRANVVFGTHTHVQTADERILDNGTGYITDLGMCGPYEGIIGVSKEPVIKQFVTQRLSRHEVADGKIQINGALFTLDSTTFRCTDIQRVYQIYSS